MEPGSIPGVGTNGIVSVKVSTRVCGARSMGSNPIRYPNFRKENVVVLNKLIGKRINGIFLGEDNTRVVFRTIEYGLIGFYVCGDCCNTVYINHFQGRDVIGEGNTFDLLRGALVTAVEEKEWVNVDTDDSYEVVEDGFFTISTDRGYIDFEVRNEHNGYYSGHIEELNDDISLDGLVPLTDF